MVNFFTQRRAGGEHICLAIIIEEVLQCQALLCLEALDDRDIRPLLIENQYIKMTSRDYARNNKRSFTNKRIWGKITYEGLIPATERRGEIHG